MEVECNVEVGISDHYFQYDSKNINGNAKSNIITMECTLVLVALNKQQWAEVHSSKTANDNLLLFKCKN